MSAWICRTFPAVVFVLAMSGVAITLDLSPALCAAVVVCAIVIVAVIGRRSRTVPIIVQLTAAALIAIVFAGLAHTMHSRVDARTEDTRDTVVSAVGPLAAEILSYQAGTVEADVENAKSRMGDPFLDEYTALTASTIIPRAKEGQVITRWEVSGSSLVSAADDRAVVLVFLRGTTVSAATPEPKYLVSSVRVSAERPHGDWLITGLEAL